jgi:hypothetical protein
MGTVIDDNRTASLANGNLARDVEIIDPPHEQQPLFANTVAALGARGDAE